jgi:exosortase
MMKSGSYSGELYPTNMEQRVWLSRQRIFGGGIASGSLADRSQIRNTQSAEYFEFSALFIASVLFWWQPVTSTVQLALNNDSFTYLLLILPISALLVVTECNRSSASSPVSNRWAGWMLLLGVLLLRSLAFWGQGCFSASDALSLSVFALVLCWIASVIVCFGSQVVRARLFPCCFLFLLVPLPEGIMNWIIVTLQKTSAIATDALFRVAQVPVTRDGVILSIPGLDIEVARECSSIRSSTMLFVLTLVLAHLFLRSNWRKALLVVLAIPFSITKNAVRIFTIAELTARVDPSYLDGRLHHEGGVVFLGLAILLTILPLWFLRKSELRTATGLSAK